MRFGETKAAKEEFYGAKKTTIFWDVDVDNTVKSKLIETNNNSKYLIGYLNVIKPLDLMLTETSWYV